MPEQILTFKTQRGRAFELFNLPKLIVSQLVQTDSSLNFKIRFEKLPALSACAQYLQAKVDRFVSQSQSGFSARATTFLHEKWLLRL